MLQRMRAGLAGLGIFIGTTTVIWLVAMGEGVSFHAQQQILELGAEEHHCPHRRADRRLGRLGRQQACETIWVAAR